MREKTRYLIRLAAVGGVLVGLLLAMGACSSRPRSGRARAVTVKGSDTMVILGQRFAEIYMQKHPGTVIQVTGGGSGTGIAALINGTTDIAQSSRPIKPEEAEQVRAKFGRDVLETPVALDGLAIYVHESNPVSELSLAQIKAIYTGRITNWKEVGGPDRPIVLYSRENNSGTYVYFKEHVLENADFSPMTQTLPGTASVINAVAKDPKAIGYGGIAYGKGIKVLKVKKDERSPGVEPSLENVASGRYPISRMLYFYTVGKPTDPVVRDFIRWVLEPEGQAVVQDVGYYPLPESKRREIARLWENEP